MQNKNHFSKKILEHITRHLLFPLTVPECEEVVGTSEKKVPLNFPNFFFFLKKSAPEGAGTHAREGPLFFQSGTRTLEHTYPVECQVNSSRKPLALSSPAEMRKWRHRFTFSSPNFRKNTKLNLHLFIYQKNY